MEQNHEHDNRLKGLKNDLTPGRSDRNLLSEGRSEAPIDQDRSMREDVASDASDENYADEELNDPHYFEKRAGKDVRK